MNQPVDEALFQTILLMIDSYLDTTPRFALAILDFRNWVIKMRDIPNLGPALDQQQAITDTLDNHERAILTWLATQKNPTTLQSCWHGTDLPEEWWKKAMGRLRQKKLVSFHSRTGKAPLFLTLAGREAIRGGTGDADL